MSEHSNSHNEVEAVFAEALRLFDQKNADYGDAWRTNGWRGNLPRVFEKVDRVRNLLWRNDPRTPQVGDESAEQTLLDLFNSLAFTLINLRAGNEYGRDMAPSEPWVIGFGKIQAGSQDLGGVVDRYFEKAADHPTPEEVRHAVRHHQMESVRDNLRAWQSPQPGGPTASELGVDYGFVPEADLSGMSRKEREEFRNLEASERDHDRSRGEDTAFVPREELLADPLPQRTPQERDFPEMDPSPSHPQQ